MKKIIQRRPILFTLGLFLIILLGMMFLSNPTAGADKLIINYSVSNETVRPGDTVTVNLYMENYNEIPQEIAAAQINAKIDPEIMEYVADSAKANLTDNGLILDCDYEAGIESVALTYLFKKAPLPKNDKGIMTFQVKIKDTVLDDKKVEMPIEATLGDMSLPMAKEIETEITNPIINIQVIKPIRIKTLPTKLEYIQGENFDPAGGIVTLMDENGKTVDKEITSEMCSGYDKDKLGKQIITVSDERGNTDTFEITVREKMLESIAISKLPNKQIYIEGTALDVTGGEICLKYDNGDMEYVALSEAECNVDMLTIGEIVPVQVKYGEKTTFFNVRINAKEIEKIKVTTVPLKMNYKVGLDKEFDPTGGKVTLYYNNETSEVKDLTKEMCTVPSLDSVGEKTISVTIDGKSDTFQISVIDKVLEKIEVTKLPDKVEYIEGTEFSPVGGEVTFYYDNNTSDEKPLSDVLYTGYDSNKIGEQIIIVSDGQGHTAQFEIVVNKKSVTSISVVKKPDKISYIEGNTLDLSGGKLRVDYNNNTFEEILLSKAVCTVNMNEVGEKIPVKVEYGEKETTFDIRIDEKQIAGIKLTVMPKKINYKIGLETILDPTGGKITIEYNNNTSEVRDLTLEMCEVPALDSVGEKSVVVSFGGYTDTFFIHVIDKELVKIEMSKLPDTLVYIEGNDFSAEGGVIDVYYDNETVDKIDLTESMCMVDMQKVDEKALVTVTYDGKTTDFNIEIRKKSVKSINVDPLPDKIEYIEGTVFDPAGAKLNVLYDNHTKDSIDLTKEMCSVDLSKPNKNATVTVNYRGCQTTFNVTVVEKNLTGISVTKKPEKIEYLENDKLALEGGEITCFYDNDTQAVLSLTDSEVHIAGYNAVKVGKQILEITYGHKTTALEINVYSRKKADQLVKDIEKMPEADALKEKDRLMIYQLMKDYNALESNVEKEAVTNLGKLKQAFEIFTAPYHQEIIFEGEAYTVDTPAEFIPLNYRFSIEKTSIELDLEAVRNIYGNQSEILKTFKIRCQDDEGNEVDYEKIKSGELIKDRFLSESQINKVLNVTVTVGSENLVNQNLTLLNLDQKSFPMVAMNKEQGKLYFILEKIGQFAFIKADKVVIVDPETPGENTTTCIENNESINNPKTAVKAFLQSEYAVWLYLSAGAAAICVAIVFKRSKKSDN